MKTGRVVRRLTIVGVTVCLGSLGLPATGMAAGGDSIATAPTVTSGVSQSGNTAIEQGVHANSLDGAAHCSHPTGNGWWSLPVQAGDTVTIDWQAPTYHFLDVYPVGTTDFTQPTSTAFAKSQISDNGHQELVFTAPVSGAMPMVIGEGSCTSDGVRGPYSFTATMTHPAPAPAPAPATCPSGSTGTPPNCVSTGSSDDTEPLTIAVTQAQALNRFARFSFKSSKNGHGQYTLRYKGKVIATSRGRLTAGVYVGRQLTFPGSVRSAVRRARHRHRSLTMRLTITVTDEAGKRASLTLTLHTPRK
jgi:hypothetical protein